MAMTKSGPALGLLAAAAVIAPAVTAQAPGAGAEPDASSPNANIGDRRRAPSRMRRLSISDATCSSIR
jgi:hypothetical protein